MLTLGDIKNSPVVDIAGVSPSSTAFRDLVNTATRRLMTRGDWPGTIVPIHLGVKAGCVVWPRYVGSIRKMNLCRHGIEMKNEWGNFLPYDRKHRENNFWQNWLGGPTRAVNEFRVPTVNSIFGDNRTIRAYIDTPLDRNKTIRIFGGDTNGQQLMTRGLGGWKDGITLTLETPYAESTQTIRGIDRVKKDVTQGPVRLFAWNQTSSVLEELATYAPDETNPSYLRSKLHLSCCNNCSQPHSIVALVKLQYVPVNNDDDWVLIENLDALGLFIQAINAEKAVDRDTARGYEMDAIRELNLQLGDEQFAEQVPVSMGELGNTGIGRQKTF